MPLQSNVNVRVAYAVETALGTQAAGAGQSLRRVASTLSLTKDAFTSNEVHPTQQVMDARHGTRRVAGNIQGELSRTTYDDFLAAALRTTWVTNKLTPGILMPSFTIEQVYPDLDVSEVFLGCRVGDVGISMPPTGMATINIGFQGVNMNAVSAASSPVYASPAAATATPVLTGVNGSLSINGTASTIITGLDINISNSLNSTPVVGSVTVPEIFYGRHVVTGNLSAYFDSLTMLNAFLNESTLSIVARLTEPGASNWLEFTMGKVKLMGASKNVGPDGGVILQSSFQALYNDATGSVDDGSLIITRSA